MSLRPVAPTERLPLERHLHRHGERLEGRAFRRALADDARLRAWHARSVHSAYGVAEGLRTRVTTADGVPVVQVEPGVAYDVAGRELVLAEARALTVPEDGTESVLVLSRPPDTRLDVVPEPRAVELAWEPADGFRTTRGVALAAGGVEDGVFRTVPSFHPTRTRAVSRPHVESGVTLAGETAWTGASTGFLQPLLEVWVDTTAAGFESTPCYFATLQGLGDAEPRHLGFFLPRLVESRPRGFRFSLWFPSGRVVLSGALFHERRRLFEARRALWLSWIGIEHRPRRGRVEHVVLQQEIEP